MTGTFVVIFILSMIHVVVAFSVYLQTTRSLIATRNQLIIWRIAIWLLPFFGALYVHKQLAFELVGTGSSSGGDSSVGGGDGGGSCGSGGGDCG